MKKSIIIFSVIYSFALFSEDLILTNGQKFKDFNVVGISEKGILIEYQGDQKQIVQFPVWPESMNSSLGRFQKQYDRYKTKFLEKHEKELNQRNTAKAEYQAEKQERALKIAQIIAKSIPVYVNSESLKNLNGIASRHYEKSNCGFTDGEYIVIGDGIFQFESSKVKPLSKMIKEHKDTLEEIKKDMKILRDRLVSADQELEKITGKKEAGFIKIGDNWASWEERYSKSQVIQIIALLQRLSSIKKEAEQKIFWLERIKKEMNDIENVYAELIEKQENVCKQYNLKLEQPETITQP